MLLIDLPADVLLAILAQLRVGDLLALRQTCRACDSITRERSVWYSAICADVFSRGIPVPGLGGQHIASLNAPRLERLTRHALRLHRNWTSAYPRYTSRTELLPPSLPVSRPRNLAVYFLPGHANRWLITITLYDQPASPRKYVIQCWDLSLHAPRAVAILHSVDATGVSVNSDPTNPAVLALSRRGPSDMVTTSVYSLDFSAENQQSAFTCLKSFPSHRNSIALDRSLFICSDVDNIVRLIDIETGQLRWELRVPLLYDDPTLRNEEHRCLGVVLVDCFVLTFCRMWIHLYILSESENENVGPHVSAAPSSARHLDPIAKHKWQWRIDSLVVSPRPSSSVLYPAPFAPVPIDILVRFDTWFPWPVNILHHFILPLNPAYSPSAPAALPYLWAGGAAEAAPRMAHSIPAPLRLFTPSDMVLGRHGTALWLDAQTDAFAPAQAGDHGQRIVGARLADADAPPAPPAEDLLAPGPGGDRAPAPLMEFHIQEHDDGWNRLALDEEEGRIAVGCVDGKVILFEYTSHADL